MKLLMRAAFNRYSGYGNDAVDIAVWLARAGVDVHLHPTTLISGLPRELTDLLTKTPPTGEHAVDATLQFAPPFSIRISTRKLRGVKVTGLPKYLAPMHYGWSMWEKDRLIRKAMNGHGIGQAPWKDLDVMYVTTAMNVEAFKHFDSRPEYRLLPCGIDPDLFPFESRTTDGPTKFCMVGELHRRKNPFVAIEAFKELREEKGDDFDADLFLKTTRGGLHPMMEAWEPRLHIIKERWEFPKLIEWYQEMDCMLAPSRGEGNHKPPMEFMATGGTVIATNWSGPTNWLRNDVGYPLDFELVPEDVDDPDSPRDAEASKDHLKQLMWQVHTDRAEAVRKGRLAAEWIRQSMSWERLIDVFVRKVEADLRAA